jgi:Fic family protein
MWLSLTGSPYELSAEAVGTLEERLRVLDHRVADLRSVGKLSSDTLRHFYGATRIEQVAESNALEGSTLDGETTLAVLKGVTLTGHDPRYQQDARNLDAALRHLTALARSHGPLDLDELKAINSLVLTGELGGGEFRNYAVRISGSSHRPPGTWAEIMRQMDDWAAWSRANAGSSAVVRSTVLHAWMTHVHPFGDGNGRTARAIGNLELIRQGFPPILIKKIPHRPRYLDALRAADDGDLAPFLDLVLERAADALRDLERAARAQGYDPLQAAIRRRQEGALRVWTASVDLLFASAVERLRDAVERAGGTVAVQRYGDGLDIESFVALHDEQSIPGAWIARIEVRLPGLQPVPRLAWYGYRSRSLRALANIPAGPSIFWSEPNPARLPPWLRLAHRAPGGEELTVVGDQWHLLREGLHVTRTTSDLAEDIAHQLLG